VGPTDFVTARKRSSKTDLFFIKAFFRLADSILHGFVEENPPETALKFLRNNLPWIIGELTERKG